MFWTSQNNHLDIVKILCRHPDVDLNLPNKTGATPLIIAAELGYISILDELRTYYPHRLTRYSSFISKRVLVIAAYSMKNNKL